MSARVTCEHCGREYGIAEWPWCPHGRPNGGIVPDSFGCAGMWIENLDATPVWVESKTQLQQEAATRGLRWEPKARTRTPIDDARGRYNGGAFPTFRTEHRPWPREP